NRELGLHGDAAAIAGGDDRVVRAVHLPFTALPVEGELIVEWSLRAVAQRTVIAGGGGHDVVGTAGQSQLHRSPVRLSRDDLILLQRAHVDQPRLVGSELKRWTNRAAVTGIGSPAEAESDRQRSCGNVAHENLGLQDRAV